MPRSGLRGVLSGRGSPGPEVQPAHHPTETSFGGLPLSLPSTPGKCPGAGPFAPLLLPGKTWEDKQPMAVSEVPRGVPRGISKAHPQHHGPTTAHSGTLRKATPTSCCFADPSPRPDTPERRTEVASEQASSLCSPWPREGPTPSKAVPGPSSHQQLCRAPNPLFARIFFQKVLWAFSPKRPKSLLAPNYDLMLAVLKCETCCGKTLPLKACWNCFKQRGLPTAQPPPLPTPRPLFPLSWSRFSLPQRSQAPAEMPGSR